MGRVSDTLSTIASAITTPFQLLGRTIGYVISLVLILLVPVVIIVASTLAWVAVFHGVDLIVGLPSLEPLGVVVALGLPERVTGIPLLYPLILGILTSLLLGWPTTDRDTDFSPPILPY